MMLKKSDITFIILLLAVFVNSSVSTLVMAMEKEYEGFLITLHSSNEDNDPAKITKECLLMAECAASGYGVSVKQAQGKYRFYKFDETGQKLAREILTKTVKNSGIIVIAKGTLDEGLLKVASLTEKVLRASVAVELTGWLIDKCCSGTKDPVSHSLECLRMKSCAATGYGVLVKDSDGSFKFYQFDVKGHYQAADYIKKLNQKNNILITVKGIWNGDLLKVNLLGTKK